MPNFGNTSAEQYNASIRNVIEGMYHTCPETATADALWAKLWCDKPWTAIIKGAIYRQSDKVLIGTTIKRKSYSYNTWNRLVFPTPKPTLVAGVNYYLCVWADTSGGDVKLYGNSLAGGYVIEKALTFGDWPSTLSGTIRNEKHSIYCQYNTKMIIP